MASNRLKAPKPGKSRKANTLQRLILADILSRQKEKEKGEAAPAIAAERTQATEETKKMVQVRGAYDALRGDLKQLRLLTLQVPNPRPGIISRFIGGAKNFGDRLAQDPSGVLLNRYNRITSSALRNMAILRANETESRFSNDDAERMKALFGNPTFDTELQEDLDFAENARNVDLKADAAGIRVERPLFDDMFLEGTEMGQALNMRGRKGAIKIMLGDLFTNPAAIADDELSSGIQHITQFQNLEDLSPIMQESMLGELERRGIDI